MGLIVVYARRPMTPNMVRGRVARAVEHHRGLATSCQQETVHGIARRGPYHGRHNPRLPVLLKWSETRFQI